MLSVTWSAIKLSFISTFVDVDITTHAKAQLKVILAACSIQDLITI